MTPTLTQRLEALERPSGTPLMHQSWYDLLFIHWQLEPSLLRLHVPETLDVDTFDGKAYIAVTPFTLRNVRPLFLPPLPLVSAFHEINVRTYVHFDDVPGVYFFSLDANGLLAVLGARLTYHLPYFYSTISMEKEGKAIKYHVKRASDKPATFKAQWSVDKTEFLSTPGSLEYFLTERYILYTERSGVLYRARIFHQPWPLHAAELHSFDSNLIEADGLPATADEPIVFAGGPVDVDVWPLERVEAASRATADDQGFNTTLTQPSS